MQPRIICLNGLLMMATMVAAQSISLHQYWIDSDFAHHQEVSGNSTTLTVTIPTEGLSPGVHFFNHRAKDSNDTWGGLYRSIFYIPSDRLEEPALQSYEYWIDSNYDNRKSGNGSTQVQAAIDISELSPGVHLFNFRSINNFGNYGQLNRQLFYIPEPEVENPVIEEVEYWIDNHTANKQACKESTKLIASLSDIGEGEHSLAFRVKNSACKWSPVYQIGFRTDVTPGDANGDGAVNTVDVTTTVNHILKQEPAVFYMSAADVDGDGKVNIADITRIIDFILNAGK